jgi:ABC-type transport system involved in cytochrome c biogenesis permease subunit
MNLFESEYIKSLMLAAFFVTLIVSAITTIAEDYYSDNISGNKRRKVLTGIIGLLISILVADFDIVFKLEWQKVLTNLLITISFSVLFYSYLGGKYITALFMWVKKLLPGQSDKI